MHQKLFAVALLSCVLLGGCSNRSNVTNIERVLKADTTTTTGAKSVGEVVGRMRAISLDGCSQDFKLAYITHIHAWESLFQVEQEALVFDANVNSGGAMLESFLRGMVFDFGIMGEARVAQDRLRANYQRASTQVRETFHQVEEIAVKHGASLPSRSK